MLRLSLIGSALIALTVVIHAIGTTAWVRYLAQKYSGGSIWTSRRRAIVILVYTVLIAFVLHVVEIVIWAATYQVLMPVKELASFEEAVYFSFVTFTTLGYGDITLSEGWRLLSGIEALNGILLLGWTTAMIFSVVQNIWRGLATKNKKPGENHD
jgi:hypothetical protein